MSFAHGDKLALCPRPGPAKVTALLVIGLIVQQILARWRASLGSTSRQCLLDRSARASVLGSGFTRRCKFALPPGRDKLARSPPTRSQRPSTNSGTARSLESERRDSAGRSRLTDRPTIAATPPRARSTGSNAVPVCGSARDDATRQRPSRPRRRRARRTGSPSESSAMASSSSAFWSACWPRSWPWPDSGARARVSMPAEWRLALDRCRRRLGINRAVGLAWSPRVECPGGPGMDQADHRAPGITGGTAPSGHADAVLLHELAHVRRGDYPWNVLLRLVEAVYWPHPLVWVLGRAIAELRERACDDLCVHELGGPTRVPARHCWLWPRACRIAPARRWGWRWPVRPGWAGGWHASKRAVVMRAACLLCQRGWRSSPRRAATVRRARDHPAHPGRGTADRSLEAAQQPKAAKPANRGRLARTRVSTFRSSRPIAASRSRTPTSASGSRSATSGARPMRRAGSISFTPPGPRTATSASMFDSGTSSVPSPSLRFATVGATSR